MKWPTGGYPHTWLTVYIILYAACIPLSVLFFSFGFFKSGNIAGDNEKLADREERIVEVSRNSKGEKSGKCSPHLTCTSFCSCAECSQTCSWLPCAQTRRPTRRRARAGRLLLPLSVAREVELGGREDPVRGTKDASVRRRRAAQEIKILIIEPQGGSTLAALWSRVQAPLLPREVRGVRDRGTRHSGNYTTRPRANGRGESHLELRPRCAHEYRRVSASSSSPSDRR